MSTNILSLPEYFPGTIPYTVDIEKLKKEGRELTLEEQMDVIPLLMGQVTLFEDIVILP